MSGRRATLQAGDRWLRPLAAPRPSSRQHSSVSALSLPPDWSQVSAACCCFNLAQLAEGGGGEGCSGLRAFSTIRHKKSVLEKSVSEKTLRVRVSSQKKFPRRVLNLRNVVHVRNELFHVRARCRDRRGVGLALSNAVRNCCNARAGRFDLSS